MCIFSQPIDHVSDTRIYARMRGDRQYLAYQMRLASMTEQAMILPLPVAGGDPGDLRFIDLSACALWFDGLDACFPNLSRGGGPVAAAASLEVHRVGAFDASFVPERAAFARLDPRFRLDDGVWDRFPDYAGFGFAVFQLRAGDARVHPMALSFRSRDPRTLFFPTAHVHDGQVHATAEFDHRLYAQFDTVPPQWRQGEILPRQTLGAGFLATTAAAELIDADAPVARRILRGEQTNGDVVVALS
ncbi:hypothetical protein [Pseudomonas sp. CGJS7]|uniref:hypothetical protein n=1 Tax=Pseudomonas sp. CGJS7 TaxID=3109348 RepID=UPI00300BD4BE